MSFGGSEHGRDRTLGRLGDVPRHLPNEFGQVGRDGQIQALALFVMKRLVDLGAGQLIRHLDRARDGVERCPSPVEADEGVIERAAEAPFARQAERESRHDLVSRIAHVPEGVDNPLLRDDSVASVAASGEDEHEQLTRGQQTSLHHDLLVCELRHAASWGTVVEYHEVNKRLDPKANNGYLFCAWFTMNLPNGSIV